MPGAKDVLGIPQMDEFVVQCERIGRTQNLDQIESHTEKDNEQQPFASISVLPDCSESDGNEDEEQAEPKESVGRVVTFAATRISGGNISEAYRGAQRDARDPSEVKVRTTRRPPNRPTVESWKPRPALADARRPVTRARPYVGGTAGNGDLSR